MRIVTFNVNGFRGMLNQGEVISEEELCINLQRLKAFIDDLKMNDEDVVILQEIPHKRLIDKTIVPWTWEEQSMFQRFVDTFDKEYKIFYPRFLIDSNQCTIGLGSKETRWKASQKHIIKYNRFHHYGNKLIEIEKENDILLGVHINPCDEMWSLIINSLNKNKVTYVVGDFNAYEKRGEMKNKPSVLRGLGYNSFIPSNVITDYKDNSSIDNFYVDNNFNFENGISIEVKKTDRFISDHGCCFLNIQNP